MILMQAEATPRLISEDEYLVVERSSEIKHEFHGGEMFVMAWSLPGHALITANLASALKTGLRGRGCLVYSPDLRVKVELTGLHTYLPGCHRHLRRTKVHRSKSTRTDKSDHHR